MPRTFWAQLSLSASNISTRNLVTRLWLPDSLKAHSRSLSKAPNYSHQTTGTEPHSGLLKSTYCGWKMLKNAWKTKKNDAERNTRKPRRFGPFTDCDNFSLGSCLCAVRQFLLFNFFKFRHSAKAYGASIWALGTLTSRTYSGWVLDSTVCESHRSQKMSIPRLEKVFQLSAKRLSVVQRSACRSVCTQNVRANMRAPTSRQKVEKMRNYLFYCAIVNNVENVCKNIL